MFPEAAGHMRAHNLEVRGRVPLGLSTKGSLYHQLPVGPRPLALFHVLTQEDLSLGSFSGRTQNQEVSRLIFFCHCLGYTFVLENNCMNLGRGRCG